jgi:Ca2+/Na+ antiporter
MFTTGIYNKTSTTLEKQSYHETLYFLTYLIILAFTFIMVKHNFKVASSFCILLLLIYTIFLFIRKYKKHNNKADILGSLKIKDSEIILNETKYAIKDLKDVRIEIDGYENQLTYNSSHFSKQLKIGHRNRLTFYFRGDHFQYYFGLDSYRHYKSLMQEIHSIDTISISKDLLKGFTL